MESSALAAEQPALPTTSTTTDSTPAADTSAADTAPVPVMAPLPPPTQLVDAHYTKTLEELKAEARAIALADTCKPRGRKKPGPQPWRRQVLRPPPPSAARVADTMHAQNIVAAATNAQQQARTKQQPQPQYQYGMSAASDAIIRRKAASMTTPASSSRKRPLQVQQQAPQDSVATQQQQYHPVEVLPPESIRRKRQRPTQAMTNLDTTNTTADTTTTHLTVIEAAAAANCAAQQQPQVAHAPPTFHLDADYALFVRNLVATQGADDGDESVALAAMALADDEDDDEFVFDDEEEDEDEHEDDDDDEDEDEEEPDADDDKGHGATRPTLASSSPKQSQSPLRLQDNDIPVDPVLEWESSIKQELEWLHEEDLQAAVATLLDHPVDPMRKRKSHPNLSSLYAPAEHGTSDVQRFQSPVRANKKSLAMERLSSPIAATIAPTASKDPLYMPVVMDPALQHLVTAPVDPPTEQQVRRFHALLQSHYQMLVQQLLLTVRTAHEYEQRHIKKLSSGSTLQAAPENALITKEDVVFSNEHFSEFANVLDLGVKMLQDLEQNRKDAIRRSVLPSGGDEKRRLTRAQFLSKTQMLLQENAQELTVFALPGLHKLKETFTLLDNSVVDAATDGSLLADANHAKACERLFEDAGARYDTQWLPEAKDVSEYFTDAAEYLGIEFKAPCTPAQQTMLRRHRGLLTSGEDSLVWRGVNLYGEKQWDLIKDRFLPDRTSAIVSRRYNKLSVMVCRSFGVEIGEDGDLPLYAHAFKSWNQVPATRYEQLRLLRPVNPPAIFNVHRWEVFEDVALLKAVKVLGTSWAIIRSAYLPHRDRTHIRKRYDVLTRRIKSTVGKLFLREGQLFEKWVEKRQVQPQAPECGAVNLAAMILRKAKADSMAASPSAHSNADSEFMAGNLGMQASQLFGHSSFASPSRDAHQLAHCFGSDLPSHCNDDAGAAAVAATTTNVGPESSRSRFEQIATGGDADFILDKFGAGGISNFATSMSPAIGTSKSGHDIAAEALKSPPRDASRDNFGGMPMMSNLFSPSVDSSRAVVERLIGDRNAKHQQGHAINQSNLDKIKLQTLGEESLSNESFASGLGLDMSESNGFSFLEPNAGESRDKQHDGEASRQRRDLPQRIYAGILDQTGESCIKEATSKPVKRRATLQSISFSSPTRAKRPNLMEPPPPFGTPPTLPTYQSIQPYDLGETLGSFAAPAGAADQQLPAILFDSVMNSAGLRTPIALHNASTNRSTGSTPRALFSPDDRDAMEAISALGQLSQTPPPKGFRARVTGPSPGQPIGRSGISNNKRKSLFEQVVGDSKKKSTKKR